jgi:hypothetical protein
MVAEVCPSPPAWRPITEYPSKAVTLAANLAIEWAYKREKGNHVVLFGSQFELGFDASDIIGDPPPRTQTELRLPDGVPNSDFGNFLLKELRGPKGGPRKPDIIDFNDRAFYEIKPVRSFELDPGEAIQQHVSLYQSANSIVNQYNIQTGRPHPAEPPWVIENSTWVPPKCLLLPGLNGEYRLDTYETDYSKPGCRGIIIYRVWRKVRRQDEEKTTAVSVAVMDKKPNYSKVTPDADSLRAAVGRYNADEPKFVIIVPKYIDDLVGNQTPVDLSKIAQMREKQNAASRPSMISQVTTTIANHPVLTGVVVIAVAATGIGLFLWLGAGAAAAGAAVLAEETATAGAGALASEAGATVVSLAARRVAIQAAAKQAIRPTAAAASILLMFGQVKDAKAGDVNFSGVDAMRVVPASSFCPYKGTYSALSSGACISDPPENFSMKLEDLSVGDRVMYDSKPYAVIATLTAYPNNLGTGQ